MKCTCKRCQGTGEVTCFECDGKGTYEGGIETVTLEKNIDNYDELMELQKDAKRVIHQAERLKAMNPSRAESYREQLKATLLVINSQAEQVSNSVSK